MTMAKITCPKCVGAGLTGLVNLVVCTECTGLGTITVDDTQSVATVSAASQVPLEESSAPSVTAAIDQTALTQTE